MAKRSVPSLASSVVACNGTLCGPLFQVDRQKHGPDEWIASLLAAFGRTQLRRAVDRVRSGPALTPSALPSAASLRTLPNS
jgi:hypothetical protein